MLGQRIPVLTAEGDVQVDPAAAAMPMSLPEPVANSDWTQSGGNATKSMGQLALGTALARAFTVQAGRGSSLTARLAAAPVVAGGRVYTIDTLGAVRAFDASNGGHVWASQTPDDRGNEAVALRRRHRLRQRPHLRDQRPRLCRRRSTCAPAGSSGRSGPAGRCAAPRPSPTARSM